MDRYTFYNYNGEARLNDSGVFSGRRVVERLAAYEDIGKEPKEIQEILDKDNRLISAYAEENERLKRQLAEVTKVAKAVHDATIELDAVINL